MNLQGFWSGKTPLNFLLLPLAWVFGLIVAIRHTMYEKGLLTSSHPGVPVIVVGNLNAGGSGKTPFVIWLAEWLKARGYCPGVISRGYGRRDLLTRYVSMDSLAEEVGDEPLLIHARTGVPVAVGSNRLEAARLLLARSPGVDIIVSDDGLQHYRMRRDLELVLVDAEAGFGNGWMLPAGPLREPVSRLNRADAMILTRRNDATMETPAGLPVFGVRHEPAGFVNLADGRLVQAIPHRQDIEDKNHAVLAVAGIARPQAFFNLLTRLGVRYQPRVYPDHHVYHAADLDRRASVVMTEKDAVKCRAFAGPDWWSLLLKTVPDDGLEAWLARRLASQRFCKMVLNIY
ncbi:MAG: tetraacyldisaccharide 4'-kinase [Hydrogenophilaceae bacterium]|nr:tetraacyldisaccharide 4'-kinase [Hydrogenophilaceae bacterium]